MKEKLKVFGIEFLCLLAVVLVTAGVAWLLFSDKYPFELEAPEAKTYSKLDRTKYQVSASGIEDEENPKEIFTTSSTELESNQTEIRYVPGKVNPFDAQNGNSNLPTEVVSTSTTAPSGSGDEG